MNHTIEEFISLANKLNAEWSIKKRCGKIVVSLSVDLMVHASGEAPTADLAIRGCVTEFSRITRRQHDEQLQTRCRHSELVAQLDEEGIA